MIRSHTLRSLRRTPVFTLTAIATLAVGLAAIGILFAIVHGVLLAPLPYRDAERLVSLGLTSSTQAELRQPPVLFEVYEREARHFDGIAFYRTGNANLWIEGDDAATERVDATWITASMLPLLGIEPLLGRGFNADEERFGGTNAVILGEAEWRSRYGASPDVLGKTLTINSVPREIVGVMPARFAFPTAQARVWLPIRRTQDAGVGDFSYSGIARLAPDADAAQARQALTAALARLSEQFPRLTSGGATATWLDEIKPAPLVTPWREFITHGIARTLWMLAAVAALLLLIVWANVTNLILIRADHRQQELTVRVALGGDRWRVLGPFLSEALALCGIAALLAVVGTRIAVRAFVTLAPEGMARLESLEAGAPVIAFIVAIALVSAAVCAIVPALRARRALMSTRQNLTPRTVIGDRRQRLRSAIAVVQIALALVVSAGSALLLRTAQQLRDVPPGFDGGDTTVIWTQLPFARYDDAAATRYYGQLVERARQLPFVQYAGLAMHVPLGTGESVQQTLRVGGRAATLPVNIVDDGYFDTLRIPVLAGQGFARIEQTQNRQVVLNRRAASTLFGDAGIDTVIGKTLALAPTGPSYTVIGVVGDTRDQDLTLAPGALIYRAQGVPVDANIEPGARRSLALLVRADAPASTVIPAIRAIARELDATVPVFNIEAMPDIVRASTARLSLALALMSIAALVALLLATLGLYGVMAYAVTLRHRELGIRAALGARPTQIGRLIARHGLTVTALGIATGFALYTIAAPALRALLYGVTAADPVTLIATPAILFAAALLATWLPARQAARVDPAQTLRAQ